MTEQEKREKVIKGLECAIDPDHFGFKNCHDCFYRKDVDHLQYVCDGDRCISDALALLKAQEPVEPVFERIFMSDIEIYDCGKCGTSIGAKGIAKYCMKCGRPVKWE